MATEYATLVFKADTQEIGEAYNQLRKLNQQGKVTDKTLRSFEKQMEGIRAPARGAGGALGGMGRQAGQAGIQIQQLVGQVQAGTNPMVALSQQAADLGIVLGLPLLGAVTGIAAAFAGPLIFALTGSAEATEDMREKAEELAETVDDLTDVQRKYFALLDQRAQEEARKQVEALRNQLEGLNTDLNNVTQSYIAMEQFTDSSAEATNADREEKLKLEAQIDTLNQEIESLQDNIDRYNGATNESAESQKKAREEAEQFTARIKEQVDTFGMSRDEILLYKASLLDLNPQQQLQVDILAELIAKKEADAEATKKQAEQEDFLTRLRKAAVQQTERLRKEQAQKDKEAIAADMASRQAADQAVLERVREMEAAESELRSAGLLDAERDEFDSFRRRKEMLDQHYQDRLITEQQYQDAKRNLEKQAQDAAIGQLGEGLNALAQYNESAFKAAKAFNLANAIMNTYTGATKALATYPPPFNFIAAAGVVASGLAQVAAIRSQTYQGRALGGQVRAGESYVVGERGPEVLTMGSGGRITPNEALNRAGREQPVSKVANISFNISTVDASGFDQLLQSRRGQIIGMINTAMNDQGRRALV